MRGSAATRFNMVESMNHPTLIDECEFDAGSDHSDLSAVVRRPADLLSREQLAQFSERSDAVGLGYLIAHFALICLGGWLTIWAVGSAWLFVVFPLHAIIIGFLFSPLHECAHSTAFRSRWLNEAALWLVALVYIVPPYFFRYFHLGHHRYTQVPGKDPSLVLPNPSNVRQYWWYCAGLWFWYRNTAWILQHTFGVVSPTGDLYVPKARRQLLVREARIMSAVYLALTVGAALTGTLHWLVLAWVLPRLAGEPVQRVIRVSEHVGCEENEDLLRNTRTTLTNRWINWIAWQMPFHTEHHLFPNVPFHQLPAVHALVKQHVIVEPRGYIAGQRKIVSNLASSKGTGWATEAAGPTL